MKKLLLILTLLFIGAGSVYGMEPDPTSSFTKVSKDRPDQEKTFPMIYHQLVQILPREIVQHIFSLRPNYINFNLIQLDNGCCFYWDHYKNKSSPVHDIIKDIIVLGYYDTMEWFNHSLMRRSISICDVKNGTDKGNLLYAACSFGGQANVQAVKLYLRLAGKDAWKLLTDETKSDYETAFVKAVFTNSTETVKILLDAAGDNTWTLLSKKYFDDDTILHRIAPTRAEIVKVILDAAGKNKWTLLTMKNFSDSTTLHLAARYNPQAVEFILDAAGDQAQVLMDMRTKHGITAWDCAIPEAKEVMRRYKKINVSSI